MPSKTYKLYVYEIDTTNPKLYVIGELGRGYNNYISRYFRDPDNALAACRALQALGPKGVLQMRKWYNGKGKCPLASLETEDIYHD